jgi:hypothetical protein
MAPGATHGACAVRGVILYATVTVMKMTDFWDVAPFIFVELTDVSDVLTAFTSGRSPCETSVSFYETTRNNIPDDIFTLVTVRTSDITQYMATRSTLSLLP